MTLFSSSDVTAFHRIDVYNNCGKYVTVLTVPVEDGS